MNKTKRIVAYIIVAAFIFLLAACDDEPIKLEPTPQTVEQQDVALIYNDAVNKLLVADSYTMTGSVNSSAVMGDVLTSVVTSIDCRYDRDENGAPVMLMDCEQRYDGKIIPHTTYFADGKYYISALDEKYFVTTNDFGDYDAAAIIKTVEDTIISNYSVNDTADGRQIRFEIPYGVYASEALDNLIGMFADDSLLKQPVTVRAGIDAEGMLTSVYVELQNFTTFDNAPIEQSVILSLQLMGYNETEVTAPQDLADYEERTADETIGQNPEGEEPPEEFTGDSLD